MTASPSSRSADPERPSASRGRFILATVVTALALAALLSLGAWQVERLAWKEALVARIEARVDQPPQPLPPPASWPSLDPDAIEYQPVTLTGRFDHAREIHIFITLAEPKGPIGGQGYFVMTPLTLADSGRVVFVNRGFVPLAAKDAAARMAGQVDAPVTVTGLMRPPEAETWLSPAANTAANVWFVRDPAAMAAAAGFDPALVAPFTVDAAARSAPGGLPQGGETILAFTNNHLGYAITWFGLAAVLATFYAVSIMSALRRRSK